MLPSEIPTESPALLPFQHPRDAHMWPLLQTRVKKSLTTQVQRSDRVPDKRRAIAHFGGFCTDLCRS
jgi:hypothetical protein